MTAETILAVLIRFNVVASAAILLVLLLRPLVLHRLGARVAYWLWLAVPIASAASFLPARERILVASPTEVFSAAQEPTDAVSAAASAPEATSSAGVTNRFISLPPLADMLVVAWLLGAGALLARSIVSTRRFAGASTVALIGLALGYAAWAQQPERLVTETARRPAAVWTPAADAPAGTLSHALEGQRHDYFIELAQKGDIDVVLFGATTTEMWWWAQRGKTVWDRELGSLKAANFGSQGTYPDSLVWRLQNGELDGYQAKLVVLHAFGDADRPMPPRSRFRDWRAGYAAVIAEIRARQPQAKILIFAAFHREQTLREWREVAAANAAMFAGLVDDETVFYDDYGERFYLPDGSFKPDLWRGTEPGLYEMWAEELRPWLDRFVR